MNEEEAEALEALVKSPGWTWFTTTATRELAARKELGLKAALNDGDDAQALSKLRQIQSAELTVQFVLALPVERLKQLKRTSTDGSVERRGGL